MCTYTLLSVLSLELFYASAEAIHHNIKRVTVSNPVIPDGFCTYFPYIFKGTMKLPEKCQEMTCLFTEQKIWIDECTELGHNCRRTNPNAPFPECCATTCLQETRSYCVTADNVIHPNGDRWVDSCVRYECKDGQLFENPACD